jgi:hypothetical protein
MSILNICRPRSRYFAALLRKLKAPRRGVAIPHDTGMFIDNIARQTGFGSAGIAKWLKSTA